MKKLLTAAFAVAIFGSAFAQHTPPRPGQLPPRPSHHRPPHARTPEQVAADVDGYVRSDGRYYAHPHPSSHKNVKYNNGKHNGQHKKAHPGKPGGMRRK